ncbi:MAG: YqgE/AlgH family protein [Cyclobacteriaceae bacterium]
MLAANEKPRRGDLLISEPFLPDPNFERSVILICENNEMGSFGFVLNKPTELKLADVVEEAEGFDKVLHSGGPVEENTLHYIHRCPELIPGGEDLGNGIYWGGDFEQLMSVINTRQLSTDQVLFFVGYSGWAAGQLDAELQENSWFVHHQASVEDVFDDSAEQLWRKVLRNMGGKYRMYSNYPTDPRLN